MARTTKNNTSTNRLQSVTPTGSTTATRPYFPMEGESNTVKVSNTSQGKKAVRNTRLKNTTVTGQSGMDAQAYGDMAVIGAPSDRQPRPEFEYVTSGQEDRKAEGKAIIAEWKPANASISDPHAVSRTTMEAGSYRGTVDGKVPLHVPAYHKGPGAKTYTPEDNQAISMMSTGQVSIHSPISAGYEAG